MDDLQDQDQGQEILVVSGFCNGGWVGWWAKEHVGQNKGFRICWPILRFLDPKIPPFLPGVTKKASP